jgi:glucose-6-phosphate isomerase
MASTPSSSFSIRVGDWCPAISSPPFVPTTRLPGHQEALLANCFAQSAALAFGKTADEARSELERHDVGGGARGTPAAQGVCRQSAVIDAAAVAARSANAWRLIALYEHKVFVQGVIWGLNSFDQWGVELGKAVANSILPAIEQPGSWRAKLDASTQGLLAFTRQHLA